MQEVLTNLRISKIEHRCETDTDVARYVHGRTIEKVVVKETQEMTAIKVRILVCSVCILVCSVCILVRNCT